MLGGIKVGLSGAHTVVMGYYWRSSLEFVLQIHKMGKATYISHVGALQTRVAPIFHEEKSPTKAAARG